MLHSDKKGFIEIETLVAFALLVTTVALVGQSARLQIRLYGSLRDRTNVDQLKFAVTSGLDCTQTFSGINTSTACITGAFTYSTGYSATGGDITLKRKDGTPLFTGNQMGDWWIKSKCVKNGTFNSLALYASKRKNATTAMNDLMTNQALDWEPLFLDGVTFCSGKLSTVAPAATLTWYSGGDFSFSANAPYYLSGSANWSNPSNCMTWKYFNTTGSNFTDFYSNFNHGVGAKVSATYTCPAGTVQVGASERGPIQVNADGTTTDMAHWCVDMTKTISQTDGSGIWYSKACAFDSDCKVEAPYQNVNIGYSYGCLRVQ